MEAVYVPSTWRRFAAYLIDQVCSLVMYLPFASVFFRLFFTEDDVNVSLLQLVILFFLPTVYEFLFLVMMQATPGKWMMGFKVVPAHNPEQELQLVQCVLRPLVNRMNFFFGWAIYALAFFRYDRTHLADWVAETRVIQFQPRAHRAQLRWILGIFLVFSYGYEGMLTASHVLQQIDWHEKQVNLRSLLPETGMDVDFADADEE